MPALFITATGTEIGKTFVAAGLLATLREQGRSVAVLKPVVTGFDARDFRGSDPAILARACGQPTDLASIAAISPWRFAAPLSPDIAAAREERSIDFSALARTCKDAITAADDVLLIEGIGGLMVPFNAQATVCDLIVSLDIPLLLVAGTYLGSLSHTLCALDVARHRRLRIAALVLNESPDAPVPLDATTASLANFWPRPILGLTRNPVANGIVFAKLTEFLPPD